MNQKLKCLLALAAVGSTCLLCVALRQKPALKIEWQSDAVTYHTNTWVYDEERNKTNPQPSNFFYTKTVITTNKAMYWSTYFGDRAVELGAREDGVIVWRNQK
jgi:hypothetical protein